MEEITQKKSIGDKTQDSVGCIHLPNNQRYCRNY